MGWLLSCHSAPQATLPARQPRRNDGCTRECSQEQPAQGMVLIKRQRTGLTPPPWSTTIHLYKIVGGPLTNAPLESEHQRSLRWTCSSSLGIQVKTANLKTTWMQTVNKRCLRLRQQIMQSTNLLLPNIRPSPQHTQKIFNG